MKFQAEELAYGYFTMGNIFRRFVVRLQKFSYSYRRSRFNSEQPKLVLNRLVYDDKMIPA